MGHYEIEIELWYNQLNNPDGEFSSFLEFHRLVTFLKNFFYKWQKNLSIGQTYRALRENVNIWRISYKYT